MPEYMDNQIKGLLGFLFQPEAPDEFRKMMTGRLRTKRTPARTNMFQEVLKSAVWISASILLSLTLAHLN